MKISHGVLKCWGGIGLFVLGAFGCSQAWLIKTDPFYESFLKKTSLLMTEEEIDLYVHMPDRASKSEFIEDFWKIRDPDPTTLGNENKMEFERRVNFANEWFGVPGQRRRTPAPARLHRDRGWNTDRGVAYIVLGPPDSIGRSGAGAARDPVDRDDGARLAAANAWYYERFRLTLFFNINILPEESIVEEELKAPAVGFRTLSTNSESMELAKAEWLSRDHQRGFGEPLRFKAEYRQGSLEIGIPIKSVRFRENEDQTLTAAFAVEVRVYRNNRKVDTIAADKAFTFSEEEARKLARLDIRIPYKAPGRGKYLFDLTVKADDPTILSRRRQYIKVTL